MFEAISNTRPQAQRSDAAFSQGAAMNSSEAAAPAQKSADILPFSDQMAETQNRVKEEKPVEQQDKKQVTEEMLAELERDIEAIHSVGLKFSKFDESGKTYVKIIDRANDEVIREIPSEKALILAARMDEMIGILFDKQV